MDTNSIEDRLQFPEKDETLTDAESKHYENGVIKNHKNHSAKTSICSFFLDTVLKFNLLKMLFWMKYYIKRLYIIAWHELSMDPSVRLSPFVDPPENEIKLTWDEIFSIRRRRIFFATFHLLGLLGLFYCLTGRAKLYTILWTCALGAMSSIGVTAGAHRLWSHHSFKATWQLRVILMLFQTMAIQYSLYNWTLDHRIHHKFTDTDSDPHNSNRGFFFSHIGWSVTLPHPDMVNKIKTIDMKDIQQDKIAMFQYKYYVPLVALLAYAIPTFVPWYFWGENLWVSHCVAAQLRFMVTLHGTFLINSAAHMWGTRPYDKNINPTENMIVSAATFGDGWHNYHHVFPWDYRNSELWNYKLNLSTAFIDLFALIGWAYDMKTVPSDIVYNRVKRTGDGTHHVWGWNDESMSPEDREIAEIRHKKGH